MLGMTLVTHQTGPHGRVVKRLYIEDGSAIERELYLSALVDRATSRIAFIVSTEGGMDIEEVAHKTPEKIHTFQIEPAAGYSPYVGNEIAVGAEAEGRPGQADRQGGQEPLRRVPRQGHEPSGNQSAGGDQGRQDHLPRCQDQFRRQRALPPQGHPGAARSRRGRPDGGRSLANTISPTSSSTARSAAWSTARAWPWRPWTSSSSMAASRPTSSTSAAAPPRKRSPRRSRSSSAIRNVKGILVNIFGGIMKCDIIAEGIVAAAKEVSLSRAAGGAAGRHQCRTGQEDPGRIAACPSSPPTISPTPPEDRQGREGFEIMSILVDKNTTRHLPGLHRQPGHLPFRTGDRLRHQDGRRHHPGKGGTTHLGLPVFDTVREAKEKTGADATRDLCAAALRRRRDPGSDRCGNSADRLHHRRHSGARHGQGEARAVGLQVAPDRTQLPRRHHARRMQDRHHARPHPSPRQGRHRLALRHADL